VWRGTDLVLHREIAVKLLLPQFAEDAQSTARFRAEARHAGRASHPNIAQIFDYSEGRGSPDDSADDDSAADDSADDSGQSYLVMELIDGPSLAALLEDGPVGPAYTLSVLAQVSAGLAAAHALDLVHRDIKPANLLISKSGLVKITDFGIAYAAAAAPITRTGEVVGTCSYMAPERIRSGQVGPAADLYSLGIVAYECLTGERPFRGEPLAVLLAHQERPLPPFPPQVPEAIAAFVRELTAKDPAARPASAAEVATRAEQLRVGLGGAAASRPGLPALAGTILTTTGSQPALGTVEATARLAGAAQPAEATRVIPAQGPGPVTEAASGAIGGALPRWWHGLSRRTGLSAGLAAVAVVVAAAAGLAFANLPGQASHSHSNGGASSVVKPAKSATPTSRANKSATVTPSRGAVSNLSTAPGTPATPAAGPYGEGTSSPYYGSYPASSESPLDTATPTASQSPVQTQPPASATAQPTGAQTPTQTAAAGSG
jgi:serine/threonine-protein kinase